MEIAESYIQDTDEIIPLILHHGEWHPGVIGIVASRLVEKYYRPTILMDHRRRRRERIREKHRRFRHLPGAQAGRGAHGAVRRPHKYAAGLSVEIDRLDEFRRAFNSVARGLLTEEILTPEIRIDAILTFDELTPKVHPHTRNVCTVRSGKPESRILLQRPS
jgi:single-stranded-DNA-specific exonuclease